MAYYKMRTVDGSCYITEDPVTNAFSKWIKAEECDTHRQTMVNASCVIEVYPIAPVKDKKQKKVETK